MPTFTSCPGVRDFVPRIIETNGLPCTFLLSLTSPGLQFVTVRGIDSSPTLSHYLAIRRLHHFPAVL